VASFAALAALPAAGACSLVTGLDSLAKVDCLRNCDGGSQPPVADARDEAAMDDAAGKDALSDGAGSADGVAGDSSPDGALADGPLADGPIADGADGGDASPDGNSSSCPTAMTTMVRVPNIFGSFCIDATETTNAQYLAFLTAVGSAPGAGQQSSECNGSPSHAPSPLPPSNDAPVVNVSWCDAYAYCAWAGKRMCQHVGELTNVSSWTDPTRDEWYSACLGGGAPGDGGSGTGTAADAAPPDAGGAVYPYGFAYSAAACNGADAPAHQPIAVGTMPACVGGLPGIFDMSGNVWEWEGSCTADPSGDRLADLCRARGGSFASMAADLACNADSNAYFSAGGLQRSGTSPEVGFRCCSN
jgi:formylglycine-generating enzyme required for sulfatase activity